MTPLGDNYLVKELPPEEKTRGGIIVPDVAKTRTGKAIMVFVSQDKKYDPIDIIPEPGDLVEITMGSGTAAEWNQEPHVFVKYEDILVVYKYQ